MTTQTIAESPLVPQAGAPARQRIEFRSGNEAAALAARDIGYHVMGFFPITPSTEVAENLSKMQAEGQHDIAMIAGDGEHGAAGICYGAALGGGRVLNATSSQGLLYALEQLPVQAGTRVPMVLNVAARAVSGSMLDVAVGTGLVAASTGIQTRADSRIPSGIGMPMSSVSAASQGKSLRIVTKALRFSCCHRILSGRAIQAPRDRNRKGISCPDTPPPVRRTGDGQRLRNPEWTQTTH